MFSSSRPYFVQLFDTCFREPSFIIKHYNIGKAIAQNRNIFMADGRLNHGGMFDRLKGIISVYAVSKAQKRDFFINFTHPFNLRDFLQPNSYDWTLKSTDICYTFPAAYPLILYGETQNPNRLLKYRNREAHFYYGFNSLELINKHYHSQYDWATLYHELFRPTLILQQAITQQKEAIGAEYISVHLRLMNLLGDKVELYGNCPTLSFEEQQSLIELLKNKIRQIGAKHPGKRILLSTDSNKFSNLMQQDAKIYVIPGIIKHIDTSKETVSSENLKLFLDYHMIAESICVYSLVGQQLYPSAFPFYSALIGNKPFKRLSLLDERDEFQKKNSIYLRVK